MFWNGFRSSRFEGERQISNCCDGRWLFQTIFENRVNEPITQAPSAEYHNITCKFVYGFICMNQSHVIGKVPRNEHVQRVENLGKIKFWLWIVNFEL